MNEHPAVSDGLPDLRDLRVVGAAGSPTQGHPDEIHVVLRKPGPVKDDEPVPMAIYRLVTEEPVRDVAGKLLLDIHG